MTVQLQPAATASEPLLAYLAARFVGQRENLATEALAYILSRSEAARLALIRSVRLLGADIPDDLTFRTQAQGDDHAIPDLVGEDAERRQCLIMEAKFWAGLTSAQPVTYLERIEAQGCGSLIFVVPALRADPIWQELQRRCEEASLGLRETAAPNGYRYAELRTFTGGLGLVTWRDLLTNILTSVEQAGEQTIASDVRQLQGLCNREDSEAFLPLQSEELTDASVPRRISQFCDLIDDLTSRLIAAGVGDTSGLRPTSSRGNYGRYLRIHGIPTQLCMNMELWSSKHPTPVWLRVYGPDWKPNPTVMEHLSNVALTRGTPSFRMTDDMNFPIVLPTGVERDQVLRQAEEQLLSYAEVLKELTPVASIAAAPMPPAHLDQG